MTEEVFVNRKWKIGEKIYVVAMTDSKGEKWAVWPAKVERIYPLRKADGEKTDYIGYIAQTDFGENYSQAYSGCNHCRYIHTNKKEALKVKREMENFHRLQEKIEEN